MHSLALAIPLAACVAQAAPPVLSETRELFLDDALIASSANVARRIHPADKSPHNPVLWPQEPWEGETAVLYGSVLHEGDKWRMWYHAGEGVCYAESSDGVNWHRPKPGVIAEGGQDTNVVIRRGAAEGKPGYLPYFYEVFGVHRDDADPDPMRRYKMGYLSIDPDYHGEGGDPFHGGQRRGLGVAGSPDGVHWQPIDPWATEAIVDGASHWMRDPATERYVLYGRTKHVSDSVRAAWSQHPWFPKHWGRAVARASSPDFLHWDIMRVQEAPVVMQADVQDTPCDEIYSMLVFPYESVYIGLVQMFHNREDSCELDVQLAVSRDTVHFSRVGDRTPFIPVGPVGSWDRYNQSLACNPPIAVGDELRFYYGGRTYRHSPYAGPDKGEPGGGIGFATVPRDRFVSLEASFDGGEVVTRPLMLRGNTLHLNATSNFGHLTVEALDNGGQVVATSADIREDGLDLPVVWQSGDPFTCEGPVALRFRLQNARLYAIWCTGEEG